jgi:hypothetical protein
MIGHMQDDGSLFALGQPDLAGFLNSTLPGVPPELVRSLYAPGLNDSQVISEILKDVSFQWFVCIHCNMMVN